MFLLVAVLPSPLLASSPDNPVATVAHRMRDLLPLLEGLSAPAPQAVQADAQAPTVNPARLDDPARLERDLRAALRSPISRTRLNVVGGRARIGHTSIGSDEIVAGHLVVLNGDTEVHGRIEGNILSLDGNVTVHRGGIVIGDVLAIGGRVRMIGGDVTGTMQSLEAVVSPAEPAPSLWRVVAQRGAGLAGIFVTLLVLGFGMVTFGRPNLEIVSDTVSHSFGRSFTAGLLGQILLVPTFGMLVVGLVLTVAGALLVPFAVVIYLLLAVVAILGGLLAVAHAMGETITRRRMARGLVVSPNAYRYVLTGLTALAVSWIAWVAVGWVPVAGGIIFVSAALATWFLGTVGFGAAILSRGGVREHFAGRILPPEMMTDEFLWATPQFGVPAVTRPAKDPQ
ncbi:MAG: polymer-forming cytoskeletal protein [Gemmatimonadales bacterium]|nr:polymer-forming cytoskeletal protein [Gemmatimonadales bacterium]